MEIVIISGLSGAGKSRVAAVLEDMDYYCVDNMPVSMIPKFAELCLATQGRYERVALVTDVRALENIDELVNALGEMREIGCDPRILFIEAELGTIVRRYKETRRRHPLETASRSLEETVKTEMVMLAPIRKLAVEIIDTTGLTLNKLQRTLFKKFMDGQGSKPLSITIKSFGFKNGLPIEADLLFDVRFLPNPYYVSELQEQTGLDDPVKDYVFSHDASNVFFTKLCDMFDFLLPHYIEEGKRYLIICIGCTGGKHRAPAFAEGLAEYLGDQGYPVQTTHRDIDRSYP